MRLRLFVLLLLIALSPCRTTAQDSECKCPKSIMAGTTSASIPDTIFTFSDGQSISICGYVENNEDGQKQFSEFILSDCKSMEVFDFWDATLKCVFSFSKDTLRIDVLEPFAIGENFEFQQLPCYTDVIYFKEGEINTHIDMNRTIKFTDEQINVTLNSYDTTQWSTQGEPSYEGYSEDKMQLANQLMLAAISGNEKAAACFKEFKLKFEPDGAYMEWYREMESIISLYQN